MRDDCSRWRIALKERDDDYNRGQREASPIHLISLYIDYNKSRSSVPVTALISDATSCRCGTWIAPSISRELLH